jgi:hypothetical protein
MADRSKKISELNALTSAQPADLLLIINQPGTANVEAKKITVSNFVANVTSNAVFKQTLTANTLFFSNTTNAPANSTAIGTTGELRITNNYIYVCTSANTWVRASLSSW